MMSSIVVYRCSQCHHRFEADAAERCPQCKAEAGLEVEHAVPLPMRLFGGLLGFAILLSLGGSVIGWVSP